MTTNTDKNRTARVQRRPLIAVVACIGSFALGYWASIRSHEDRVFNEGRRQLEECLSVCIASGVFVVNDQRLSELVADQGDEGNITNAP